MSTEEIGKLIVDSASGILNERLSVTYSDKLQFMDNQSNSGVNTILIVVILVIIVGALVWFFTNSVQAPEQETGLEMDLNVPAISGVATAE